MWIGTTCAKFCLIESVAFYIGYLKRLINDITGTFAHDLASAGCTSFFLIASIQSVFLQPSTSRSAGALQPFQAPV